MDRRKARRYKSTRRARKVRNTITLCALLIILVAASFAFTAKTASADNTDNKRYKYYTSIEINDGDTLWSIAEEHMTEEYSSVKAYIKEVQSLNHMSGTKIVCGTSIVIPYYSDEYKI